MSSSQDANSATSHDNTSTGSPIVINAQYIKDLSFENPNPLKNFEHSDQNPEFNVNMELNAHQVGEHSYEVVLSIKIDSKRDKNSLFIAELDYAGIFTLNNIPENSVHPVLMVQCPHFLFPFARNIIAQTTTNGGFPPFLLNPIDFAALYHQKMEEQAHVQGDGKSMSPAK